MDEQIAVLFLLVCVCFGQCEASVLLVYSR